MALKVKAVERLLKFDKDSAGEYRYVMKPEMYSTLSQAKVIREAALRSGVNQGVMQACWDAAGEVIKAWATEGHSVALPGLGSMRFGLRSKSVDNVNDVKTGLIYDRNGNEVKRVTSTSGEVEDPENGNDNDNDNVNGNDNPNEGGGDDNGGGEPGADED